MLKYDPYRQKLNAVKNFFLALIDFANDKDKTQWTMTVLTLDNGSANMIMQLSVHVPSTCILCACEGLQELGSVHVWYHHSCTRKLAV